jgi:hypothetical protein
MGGGNSYMKSIINEYGRAERLVYTDLYGRKIPSALKVKVDSSQILVSIFKITQRDI